MSEEKLKHRETIEEYFSRYSFNFGKQTPYDVVKEAVLKTVCGYHNGSTAGSIIFNLGYVQLTKNGKRKLTKKGQSFLWEAFTRRAESEANPKERAMSSDRVETELPMDVIHYWHKMDKRLQSEIAMFIEKCGKGQYFSALRVLAVIVAVVTNALQDVINKK